MKKPALHSQALLRGLLLIACWGATVCNAGFAQAPARPSHECLPENTVLTVRVPSGRAFFEALRQRTHLGQVAFEPQRLAKLLETLQNEDDEAWKEFAERLGRLNLRPDDVSKLFDGEAGFALTIEPRGDRPPLFVSLGWIEPGEDLSQRLLAAIQTNVAEQANEEHATVRVDLELSGHEVTRLTSPVLGSEVDPSELTAAELLGDDGEFDLEKFRKQQAEAQKRRDEAKVVQLGQSQTFVARLGGRLVMATTISPSEAEVRKLLNEPGAKIDFAELCGQEEATGVFARFLAAHDGAVQGGAGQGGLPALSAPGLAAALPDGLPLIELVADPRPAIALARGDEVSPPSRAIKALGLEQLGPVAYRMALDGTSLRSGFFVSSSEPRAGLWKLLEQAAFRPEPPAWVPEGAIGYGQLSFDLGAAYSHIKQLLVQEFGDQVAGSLQFVELQVKATTQLELPDLLSSLGQQHHSVTFLPKMQEVSVEEGVEDEAPGARQAPVARQAPIARQALIWQLKDEEAWKRVIATANGLAGLSGGAIAPAEEQGFTGLRINSASAQGGMFVGRGYLVLGMGPEVVETMLAALKNPPASAAQFSNGSTMKRAAELLPAAAGISYGVTDYSGYIKLLRQALLQSFESPLAAQSPLLQGAEGQPELQAALEKARALAEKLKGLLPNDEEMEGTLGVSVGQAEVTSQGLVYRSALELPPAK